MLRGVIVILRMGFSLMSIIDFDSVISFRLKGDVAERVRTAVKDNPNLWESPSHFIRASVNHLLNHYQKGEFHKK